MRGQPWSLRRREGRSIEVVFYLPGRGDHEIARSTGTADEGKAQVRAGEIWIAEMRRAGEPVPEEVAALARVSVEHAAAEFVVHLKRVAHEHREQYVERYEADLNLYVIPKGDDELAEARAADRVLWQPSWVYLDEITSAAWEAEKLRLHRKNGGPLGANSIRKLTNTLRHLLRYGVSRGWLASAPELLAPKNKLVRQEKRFRRAMPPKEREEFLRALAKYKPAVPRKGRQASHPPGTAARFYELLHFSLLRRGEAWALTQRWLDLRRGKPMIHIPAAHSKSGEDEAVPLMPRARKAIFGQVAARGGLKVDAPVFGQINVRPAFEWALAQTGIDRHGITPHHHARHASATNLAGKTKDREALKHAGRWRSNVVDDYIHTGPERARGLMRKL